MGERAIHRGGCRCGAVRFEAKGAPLLVANCHCTDCRKATGAAFATFADFPREAVAFAKEPDIFHSSAGAERLFCARCGSPLAFRGDSSPQEINMLIGAFDAPEAFTPTGEAFPEEALPWTRS